MVYCSIILADIRLWYFEMQAMPRSQVTMKYFPQIRDWISNFLDQNKDMTASLIGHNLLGMWLVKHRKSCVIGQTPKV